MMTILIGFQSQNFHAEGAGAHALSQHHCEEERVVSADLGGILGEVLYKDVAGLGFRKISASGGAQNLGQFCALGCSPTLPRPLSTGEPANDTSGFPDGPHQRGPCSAGEGRFCTNTQKPRKSRFGGLLLGRDLEASSWGPPHGEPFRAT